MNITSIQLKYLITFFCTGSLFMTNGVAQPEAGAPDNRWSFSAGPLFREFDGGQFQSGSRSASVSLPRGTEYYTLSTGAAGPESGEVLRTYSDGFVGPDTAGTTPGSLFENTTSRFGFDSNSQNNSDQTLVFQAPLSGEQGLTSMASSENNLAWSDSPGFEPGAVLELGYRLSPPDQSVLVLGQFAFLYSPFEIKGGGTTYKAGRSDTRNELSGTLTDTYQVPTGVILPLAPYSQSSASPPPGFYPRIADEPSRSLAPGSRTVSSNTVNWFNQIEESVEADVFTFSLGPEVQISIMEKGFLSLSAGGAMHLVDWKATHEETLYQGNEGSSATVREWKEQSSKTDVVWGGFAQVSGGALFGGGDNSSNYFIQAFARWDVSGDLDGKVGPSEFTLDLDAFSAGAMAGFFF